MSAPAGNWLTPLKDWPRALVHLLGRAPAVVRVVVAEVRGSSPREPGVSMLVHAQGVLGTIGGGQLEWQALAAARETLTGARPPGLQKRVLAADLGQCCGGVVQLWTESFTAADLPLLHELVAGCGERAVLESRMTAGGVQRRLVRGGARAGDGVRREGDAQVLRETLHRALPAVWLYGAGHVGQALARLAADLPLELTWIDARAELLPAQLPGAGLDAGVRILCTEDPVAAVADAPPGAWHLVMTHSHVLDYALCVAILRRGDFGWAGLIGSNSKAARFRSRLSREGLSAAGISRLVCPVGLPGIGGSAGKWPGAIAVAVAAQLLQQMDTHEVRGRGRDGTGCDRIQCSGCGTSGASGLSGVSDPSGVSA